MLSLFEVFLGDGGSEALVSQFQISSCTYMFVHEKITSPIVKLVK